MTPLSLIVSRGGALSPRARTESKRLVQGAYQATHLSGPKPYSAGLAERVAGPDGRLCFPGYLDPRKRRGGVEGR